MSISPTSKTHGKFHEQKKKTNVALMRFIPTYHTHLSVLLTRLNVEEVFLSSTIKNSSLSLSDSSVVVPA